MDKKIEKHLKKIEKSLNECGLTFDMLQEIQEGITIDVSGCREDIEAQVMQLGLSMEQDNVRHAGGGDYVKISGPTASIITLLSMIQSAYGAGFEIGTTTIAGIAVIVSAMPAIENIIDKIKHKEQNP